MCVAAMVAAAASLRGDLDICGETELVGDRVRGFGNTKAEEIHLCCGQQAERLSRHIWPAALNRSEAQSLRDQAPPCFFKLVPIFQR